MSEIYKLEPYDINKLKNKSIYNEPRSIANRKPSAIAIINEFLTEGHDCCRVCVCDTGKRAQIESTILRRSIHYLDMCNSVKVVLRDKEVFLVKKIKWGGCV